MNTSLLSIMREVIKHDMYNEVQASKKRLLAAIEKEGNIMRRKDPEQEESYTFNYMTLLGHFTKKLEGREY